MIEEINNKVQDYFAKYKDLRVLFFFDEQQEFAKNIDTLNVPNVSLLKWENNPFSIKVKLTQELKNDKVLLYLPIKQPSNQEEYQVFPLMGLLLANKELQLDDSGSFVEEFGLGRHQKSLVTRYMSELKYSSVKDVCRPILTADKLNEDVLQQAVLSAILKFPHIQSWQILITKLGTLVLNDTEFNRVTKKLTTLNLFEPIFKQTESLLGLSISDFTLDALKLIGQCIRYNQITQTIQEPNAADPYVSLKITDQEKIIQLNQLLYAVEADKKLSNEIDTLFKEVDKSIKGETIFEVYGSQMEFNIYTSSMLWSAIEQSIYSLFDNPKNAYAQLEILSLQNDIDKEIANTISFLSLTSKIVSSIAEVESYILNSPEDYILWYETKGYLIDQFYRRSIYTRKKIDVTEIPQNLQLEDIVSNLNEVYDNHTDKINREWLKCLKHKEFAYSSINHPKQYDFYKTEIEDVGQKVVVIISDALRYEAGMELLSAMHADPKNTAEVKSMIASIPSKTNIGMAQLLPANNLKFNQGEIVADDVKTSGVKNRSSILSSRIENSCAVQYSDLEGVDRNEIRELFKNDLIYVYHDVIDATGDKKVSERRTFEAVHDGIIELRKFIKSLHATFAVAKVYVTSDHGFLYNDREILDKEKEDIDVADSFQSNNRYILSKSEANPELGYCFPISKTTKFEDDVFVTIPNSINRYKKQGVGHQFVHGGGSLQELIIPLIESSRKRVDVSKKVTPQLIPNQNLNVVSNMLRFNLLQKEPVSRNEKEVTLSIGLYDDLNLVSNEEVKIMNFTSDSPSDRMLRIELVLSEEAKNVSFLKLKIFDTEDKMNALVEERIQNKTLIQPDF